LLIFLEKQGADKMEKKNDWIVEFIKSFGSGSDSSDFRNQNDFVQQQNNIEDRQQINEVTKDSMDPEHKDQNLNMNAEDESTGDEYVLELTRTTDGPDKRDVSITFSCLNDKNKYVSSTLENLCEGRYSSYSGKNLKTIAAALCNDYDYIFNYADASLAKYSDSFDSNVAIKIAKLVKDSDDMISYVDYKKIGSKLSSDSLKEFHEKLIKSNMKIYYPTSHVVSPDFK